MSSTLDLNENMTSDEIKSLADAVADEVAQERQEDRKSDAEVVVNTASVVKTSAEKKSGSDSALDEIQSEEGSGSKSDSPSWLDDKVKAEVAAYGLEESEVSEFTSREELDRVLRLLDKKAFEAGRKALAEEEEDPFARNERGQFSKKQSDEEEDDSEPAGKASNRYEVTLSKELYDDEIVDEFTRLRDHYESRLQFLESQFVESRVNAEIERFDSYVDKLGYSELFGETGSESEEELQRRKDLHVAVRSHIVGSKKLGRAVELTDQLVSRVANMVFPDEIGRKLVKQRTQKISRQSSLRQGGSPTRPIPPRDDPRDEADRLYKELERS